MKKNHMKLKIAAALAVITSFAVHASPETDAIAQKLVKNMPGLTIDAISPSVITGLYEIVSGGDVAYVTADGMHMIQGTLFNVPERKNLSENTLSKQRAIAMKLIPESSLIVYKANGKEKQVLTVFTDPSCPFCHRLHDEIPKLNDLGITIRYALYARSGEGTLTSRQLSEAICADNPKEAINRFMANSQLNATGAKCAKSEGLEIIARTANKVGLKGTPHIIASNGYANSGFMPAAELARHFQSTGL